MHTHERTLARSLQLDSDRNTPEHELAVRYLAKNAGRLLRTTHKTLCESGVFESGVYERHGTFQELRKYDACFEFPHVQTDAGLERTCHLRFTRTPAVDVGTEQEHILVKGEGQYRSFIGFLDLVINWCLDFAYSDVTLRYDDDGEMCDLRGKELLAAASERIVIEVKTTPTPIGDLLRQFRLYKEYSGHLKSGRWILATTYDPTATDVETLKEHRIEHLRISDAFKAVPLREAASSPVI